MTAPPSALGDAPDGLVQVLIGDRAVGEVLVDHPKVPLVSATGSTRMGRDVGPRLAKRFARAILELGGNNAGIVCPSADLDMALRAIAFGAMGTAGQRCTTLRRLFVHESVYDTLVPRLKKAYESVSVGSPLETSALVGPLIDKAAFDGMQKALSAAKAEGGKVTGGERVENGHAGAYYVRPALVEMPKQAGPVLEETFAPILYVMKYSDFDEALADHNAVGAGLSSSIFTRDLLEVRALPVRRRLGLRHRQRQYRHVGRRNRRRVRRREGDRRRPRKRLGRLEGLYAPRHQHGELFEGAAAGAGRFVRYRLSEDLASLGSGSSLVGRFASTDE